MNTKIGEIPVKLFAVVIAGTYLPVDLKAQDYEYTITDEEVTITEYIGEGGDVVIPAEIDGFPVTAIESAFGGCENHTSISIPASVTSIGDFAFGTFCSGNRDEGPTEILVAEDNLYYCSIDGVLFDKTVETLIVCPWGWAGEFVIPASVTTIEDRAFAHCYRLTSVTIPDSVISIGHDAFWACGSLTSVTLGNSVTTIEEWAFGDTPSLTIMIIPASVTYVGCCSLRFGDWRLTPPVYFLGNPPAGDPYGEFAMPYRGHVYYIEGTPGWGEELGWHHVEEFIPFDPDWLWGIYEYVEEANNTYTNTGAWLGWLEVTHSPWVWHIDSGCCLYIEESVGAAGRGWIYAPNLVSDAAELWLVMEPDSNWGWSYGLSKWLYVPSGSLEAAAGWVYLADW